VMEANDFWGARVLCSLEFEAEVLELDLQTIEIPNRVRRLQAMRARAFS
jgi:hypothetical protein